MPALDDFDSAKNAFMKAVSHNLRSPLGAVLSNLRVLATGVVKDESDINKLIGNALTRAEDALAIIDDMLALLEIRTGTLPPPSETDVEKTARAVMKKLEQKAAGKNIVFSFEHIGKTGTIFICEKLFHIVLLNLMDNAVKYSDPGNTVEIRMAAEVDALKLEVADRGLVIGNEEMNNIYIEFWRAPNAKKYADHGTGLGLSIAKEACAAMGGGITASSAPESGTNFIVSIPINKT